MVALAGSIIVAAGGIITSTAAVYLHWRRAIWVWLSALGLGIVAALAAGGVVSRDSVPVFVVSVGLGLALGGGAIPAVEVWKRRILARMAAMEAQARQAEAGAETAAQAVEKLRSELDKSIFEILAIYEFTSVMGSIANLGDLADTLVDTMLRVVDYDACALLLLGQDQQLQPQTQRGFSDEQINNLCRESRQSAVRWAILTGQPLIVGDILQQDRSRWLGDAGYRSLLCIPLTVRGSVVAVLVLTRKEASAFSQDDVRLLLIISNQAAFAIQNAQLFAETRQMAITDDLTGLYNYRYFRNRLDEEVQAAASSQKSVAMIMIDLDHFKAVNDRYGHQKGDEVLHTVGRIIKENVRASDFVARYGGEEFAVILPDADAQEATRVSQRIREAISSHDFGTLRLTASMGIAVFPSQQVRTRDELLSIADKMAYAAKASGRNSIFLAEDQGARLVG